VKWEFNKHLMSFLIKVILYGIYPILKYFGISKHLRFQK